MRRRDRPIGAGTRTRPVALDERDEEHRGRVIENLFVSERLTKIYRRKTSHLSRHASPKTLYLHSDFRKREKAVLKEKIRKDRFHHQRRLRGAKPVLNTRLGQPVQAVRKGRRKREKKRSKLIWKGGGIVLAPRRHQRAKSPTKVKQLFITVTDEAAAASEQQQHALQRKIREAKSSEAFFDRIFSQLSVEHQSRIGGQILYRSLNTSIDDASQQAGDGAGTDSPSKPASMTWDVTTIDIHKKAHGNRPEVSVGLLVVVAESIFADSEAAAELKRSHDSGSGNGSRPASPENEDRDTNVMIWLTLPQLRLLCHSSGDRRVRHSIGRLRIWDDRSCTLFKCLDRPPHPTRSKGRRTTRAAWDLEAEEELGETRRGEPQKSVFEALHQHLHSLLRYDKTNPRVFHWVRLSPACCALGDTTCNVYSRTHSAGIKYACLCRNFLTAMTF